MAYPYTNEEIQQIADTVAKVLFGHLTKNLATEIDRSIKWDMIARWSKINDDIWEVWSNYCKRNSSIARSKGMHREMLSGEQRAMVCSTIHQTLSQASSVLKQYS